MICWIDLLFLLGVLLLYRVLWDADLGRSRYICEPDGPSTPPLRDRSCHIGASLITALSCRRTLSDLLLSSSSWHLVTDLLSLTYIERSWTSSTTHHTRIGWDGYHRLRVGRAILVFQSSAATTLAFKVGVPSLRPRLISPSLLLSLGIDHELRLIILISGPLEIIQVLIT